MKIFLFIITVLIHGIVFAEIPGPTNEPPIVFSNLMNHLHAQAVFDATGETRLEFTDVLFKMAPYNSIYLLEFQAGLSDAASKDSSSIDPVASVFFRLDPYLREIFSIQDIPVIRSIEMGPLYGYDFREKHGYLGLQLNFVFSIS